MLGSKEILFSAQIEFKPTASDADQDGKRRGGMQSAVIKAFFFCVIFLRYVQLSIFLLSFHESQASDLISLAGLEAAYKYYREHFSALCLTSRVLDILTFRKTRKRRKLSNNLAPHILILRQMKIICTQRVL